MYIETQLKELMRKLDKVSAQLERLGAPKRIHREAKVKAPIKRMALLPHAPAPVSQGRGNRRGYNGWHNRTPEQKAAWVRAVQEGKRRKREAAQYSATT